MPAFTGWINRNFQKAQPHHLRLFWVIMFYWVVLIFLVFYDRYFDTIYFSLTASSIGQVLTLVFAL
jgi:hypothetical protein